MSDILIVEDEELNANILERTLRPEGYTTHHITNGHDALSFLETTSEKIELILLDWMIPEMNGLDCLKQIKTNPKLSQIPVIMQTARFDEVSINEGIKAGAYYYFVKPYDRKLLKLIVKTAIEDSAERQIHSKELEELRQGLKHFNEGNFQISKFEEIAEILPLLCSCFPSPEKVVVGVNELLLNAIEHGTLEISYEEKGALLKENKWLDEIKTRQESEKYHGRTVSIYFKKNHDSYELTISDQGNGFDPQAYLDFDPARIFDLNGRGIAFAKNASFDKLSYNDKGNEVTATVYMR